MRVRVAAWCNMRPVPCAQGVRMNDHDDWDWPTKKRTFTADLVLATPTVDEVCAAAPSRRWSRLLTRGCGRLRLMLVIS